MDDNTSIELRKALDYLKAGDAKNARPILVRLLKANPDIEQAWYMLSFVVSEYTKQKYALEQALRINPSNQKARTRLAKLSGGLEMPPWEGPSASSPAQMGAEQAQSVTPKTSAGDLFHQRLGSIGIQPEDEVQETETQSRPPVAAQPPKKKRGKPKKEKKKKQKKEKKKKKRTAAKASSADPFAYVQEPAKKPRSRLLLLFVAIIVLVGLIVVVFSNGSLIGDLLQFPGAGGSLPPGVQPPQATPTPEGSGGRRLPPTWTPTVTITPVPTSSPTLTPAATEPPTS